MTRHPRRAAARSPTSAASSACGGFSYGDVLGAGEGWAKSILFNARARDEFAAFFARDDTFALGVCNGCQMMSNLHELIPGTAHWPRFVRNRSEQFEARFVLLEVQRSPSLFFAAWKAAAFRSRPRTARAMPISRRGAARRGAAARRAALRRQPRAADRALSDNPNGSPEGITGLTTPDGRFTILMPHPERVFRTVQMSWQPARLGRGFAVDADVPQRARLARLKRSAGQAAEEIADDADRVVDRWRDAGRRSDRLRASHRRPDRRRHRRPGLLHRPHGVPARRFRPARGPRRGQRAGQLHPARVSRASRPSSRRTDTSATARSCTAASSSATRSSA